MSKQKIAEQKWKEKLGATNITFHTTLQNGYTIDFPSINISGIEELSYISMSFEGNIRFANFVTIEQVNLAYEFVTYMKQKVN